MPVVKKELGQNWLNDSTSLEAMLDAAGITKGDNVLEIGPGTGYLTDKLLSRGARVTVLEFDRDLIPRLEKKYKNNPNQPIIIEGDIRDFDLGHMPKDYKICANIPYYLTANLMRKLTDDKNKPSSTALLVQKEVAEKIAGPKGSMLSTLVSAWYETSLGPIVPAELFTPVPKVNSQVLRLTLKESPIVPYADWPALVRVVKIGFSSPRKKLRANVAAGLNIEKTEADKILNDVGISIDARAEALSLADWLSLMPKL